MRTSLSNKKKQKWAEVQSKVEIEKNVRMTQKNNTKYKNTKLPFPPSILKAVPVQIIYKKKYQHNQMLNHLMIFKTDLEKLYLYIKKIPEKLNFKIQIESYLQLFSVSTTCLYLKMFHNMNKHVVRNCCFVPEPVLNKT